MRRLSWGVMLLVALSVCAGGAKFATAAEVTIYFEELEMVEGDPPIVPGVFFTNAVVLTDELLGGALNTAFFPPHSGDNVIANYQGFDFFTYEPVGIGPMQIAFLNPISFFGAFFTYQSPLLIQGFSVLGGSALASDASPLVPPDNFASPNTEFTLDVPGIRYVVITVADVCNPDCVPGQFTLDTMTFRPQQDDPPPPGVPEPSLLTLVVLGGLGMWRTRSRKTTA